ncbi:MAG: epimerase [Acidimicrobiales bacterium]|nr:epimerase [Acidimicrobiales bacterium]
MDVLVIGGTGPSGPLIVNGLFERGHRVTVLHTGRHEVDALPPMSAVPHIHCDPFDEASVRDGLGERTFDVVFAMYGRLRMIVDVLVGRTPRLFSIGGIPVYKGFADAAAATPSGMKVLSRESDAGVGDEATDKIRKIWLSEQLVFDKHPDATHFRYPYIYGPNQVVPREWPIVKRALDRRPHLILPDGGLTLFSHAYVENAAHGVLLAVDQIDRSAGRAYNITDDYQLTVAQLAELVMDEVGHRMEVVSVPDPAGRPARSIIQNDTTHHRVVDASLIRDELGYADLVDPIEAHRRTIRWQIEHLGRDSAGVDRVLEDPYDYEAEDRLVALQRRFMADAAAIEFTAEPGFTSGYYGPTPNPAGARRSMRG